MKKIALVFALAVVCFQFSSCSKKDNELDYNAQLEKDIATIDAFLATNHITAIQDSSGIRYTIQHLGTGINPVPGGKVSVRFTGTLLNGQTFDQSSGITFYLKDVIAGWRIILPKMAKGTKFTMYIPSGLAFGHDGGPMVPGDANLIFETELLDDDLQLLSDVAKIDNYLDSIQATDVHKDSSGVRYVYSGDPGTGPKPGASSNVAVTYTGRFLSNNVVFETQDSPTFILMDQVIEGWSIALQEIPVGSFVRLYIPSGLAYGAGGTNDGVIPANANLIFDVHVIAIN